MNKTFFWNLLYRRWRRDTGERQAGYTLLLPVPGDLPLFTRIALAVAARQDPTHRIEALVIPDAPTGAFEAELEQARRNHPDLPVRLVSLRPKDRLFTRYRPNPHTNYWLQLINGVEQATTSHALLHDADLFLTDPGFLRHRYERAVAEHLDCLGASPVWDQWFRDQGYSQITATWELLFRIDWARSFAPWMHRGHENRLDGQLHTFDATLYPQCLTPSERIAHGGEDCFIHFNYVIGTYRWYQQADHTFADDAFRILLIRLLCKAFDDATTAAALPDLDAFARGLHHADGPVSYVSDQAKRSYPEFRRKLGRLMASDMLDEPQRESLAKSIAPFDDHFAW